MTCASIYTPQLRARGFRMTPQRMAILHVLHHAGTHLSPGEIYAKARRELSGLTEPTVYRTLDFLVENGLVHSSHDSVPVSSGTFVSVDLGKMSVNYLQFLHSQMFDGCQMTSIQNAGVSEPGWKVS